MQKQTTKTVTTPRGTKCKLMVSIDHEDTEVFWAVQYDKFDDPDHSNFMNIEMYADGTWLPCEETLAFSILSWLKQPLQKCMQRLGMRDDPENNYYGIFE